MRIGAYAARLSNVNAPLGLRAYNPNLLPSSIGPVINAAIDNDADTVNDEEAPVCPPCKCSGLSGWWVLGIATGAALLGVAIAS